MRLLKTNFQNKAPSAILYLKIFYLTKDLSLEWYVYIGGGDDVIDRIRREKEESREALSYNPSRRPCAERPIERGSADIDSSFR